MSPKVPPPLVLLADDFQDALELYSEYLGSHGFRVATAVNGFEAVEAARRLQPAVIVMETWMPVLSGLAAAQVLRGDPKLAQVPMLALTASVMPPQRAAALDAGFNEVIAKPCLPDALEAAVRHALRSAGGYGVRPDSAGRLERRVGRDRRVVQRYWSPGRRIGEFAHVIGTTSRTRGARARPR